MTASLGLLMCGADLGDMVKPKRLCMIAVYAMVTFSIIGFEILKFVQIPCVLNACRIMMSVISFLMSLIGILILCSSAAQLNVRFNDLIKARLVFACRKKNIFCFSSSDEKRQINVLTVIKKRLFILNFPRNVKEFATASQVLLDRYLWLKKNSGNILKFIKLSSIMPIEFFVLWTLVSYT